MLKSMTGFGSKEADGLPIGKVRVELRSTNHKFLETVMHLPAGFLSLEDKIKKTIEAKIKRGRVICSIDISCTTATKVSVNKDLLKSYILAMRQVKNKFGIKDNLSINTLMHLPGAITVANIDIDKPRIWVSIKALVDQALDELVKTRGKEGAALSRYIKMRLRLLEHDAQMIKTRFREVTKRKASRIENDDERASFLKSTDITEEIERIVFHIHNFKHKFTKNGPMGKELDFIAQEMQREANTLAAKTADKNISVRIVQIKSQIEKIREQLQNIE